MGKTKTRASERGRAIDREPLKSALALLKTDLSFQATAVQVFPEHPGCVEIERNATTDRLAAAWLADVFLQGCVDRIETGRRSPLLTEHLMDALGVWATTRAYLGLEDEAQMVLGHVLKVLEKHPGTVVYGRALRRSAWLSAKLSETAGSQVRSRVALGADRALRTALLELSALPDAEDDIGAVQLDFGYLLLKSRQHERGRHFLNAALRRLETPHRIFQARFLIACSHVEAGDLITGAELTVALPEDDPVQRYAKLHLAADVHRAAEEPVQAMKLRLEGMELGVQLCGAERRLDDLIAAAELSPELPLCHDRQARLTAAAATLENETKDSTFPEPAQWASRGRVPPVELRNRLRKRLRRHHQRILAEEESPFQDLDINELQDALTSVAH